MCTKVILNNLFSMSKLGSDLEMQSEFKGNQKTVSAKRRDSTEGKANRSRSFSKCINLAISLTSTQSSRK